MLKVSNVLYLGKIQEGSGTTSQLFDIKTVSQNVAQKGFAYLCNDSATPLAKASIPTAYANKKSLYDNVPKVLSDIESAGLSDGKERRNIYKENGLFYYNSANTILSSENGDLSEPTLVVTPHNIIENAGADLNFTMGININVLFGSQVVGDIDFCAEIYDKDWTYIRTISFGSALIDNQRVNRFKIIDGYIYSCGEILFRVADSETATEIEVIYDSAAVKKVYAIEKLASGRFVIAIKKIDDGKCIRIVDDEEDFNTFTENVPTNLSNLGDGHLDMIQDNGTLYLVDQSYHKYTSTNGVDWTAGSITYINTPFKLAKIGTSFKIFYATKILSSTDFITFNIEKEFSISDLGRVYCLYADTENILFGEKQIAYSGLVKQTYTDTYNIDGTPFDITYYLGSDESKIVFGASQDTNLAKLYTQNGFVPYFVLNTTAETLTLMRIKNKWAVMYVGDNFEDTSTITGVYDRPALYQETFVQLATKQDILFLVPTTITPVSGTATVVLEDSKVIYDVTPVEATTLVFDVSGLTIPTNNYIAFNLTLNMSAGVQTMTFPASVQWGNVTPTLTSAVKYMFSFFSPDGGTTWIGNQSASWIVGA